MAVCLSVHAGMPFDIAIRVYLDSFRLPGESQKINRIMESFGARYHMQCPELFKNPDVVYILAYSTIMLNTDQHNSQVCLCDLSLAASLHPAVCLSLCVCVCACVPLPVCACFRVCVTCGCRHHCGLKSPTQYICSVNPTCVCHNMCAAATST